MDLAGDDGDLVKTGLGADDYRRNSEREMRENIERR